MFKITYKIKQEWLHQAEAVSKLHQLVYENVAEAFRGRQNGGRCTFNILTNQFEIEIFGAVPINGSACQALIQCISSNMAYYKLDQFLELSKVTFANEVGCVLIDPQALHVEHYPNTMLAAFNKGSIPVPKRFIDRISQRLYYRKEDGDEVALAATSASTTSNTAAPAVQTEPVSTNALNQTLGVANLLPEFRKLLGQALRRLANAGKLEEVKVILAQVGVNEIINMKDDNPVVGNTALHFAVLKGHKQVVEYLLQHGARTDIRNAEGRTAAELIAQSENAEIKALLDVAPTEPVATASM